MKFLAVIHYPVFGGPHNRVLRLADPLLRLGASSAVVLPVEQGDAARRLREGGVEVIQIPLHRLRARIDPRPTLNYLRSLRREVATVRCLIRERDIDVVLIGGLANPHGALAAQGTKAAVVWQIIDTRTPAPVLAVMRPVVARTADALMFGGEALRDHNFPRELPRVPSIVCSPPVDGSLFVPSLDRRSSLRKALGIPADAPVVGMVANLTPQKGIEYFVRAAARISKADSRVHFVLAGARYNTHAAYFNRIMSEISTAKLPSGCFHMIGGSVAVESVYPAFDVKVISSVPRSEGTTTTAIESLACCVPVVATNVGAIREVVVPGETGALVEPGRDDEIARSVLELLMCPATRLQLGLRGRDRTLGLFDVELAARRYISIGEAAIAHRRSRERNGPGQAKHP